MSKEIHASANKIPRCNTTSNAKITNSLTYVTLYHKPLGNSAKMILRYTPKCDSEALEMYTYWKIQTTVTLLHNVL